MSVCRKMLLSSCVVHCVVLQADLLPCIIQIHSVCILLCVESDMIPRCLRTSLTSCTAACLLISYSAGPHHARAAALAAHTTVKDVDAQIETPRCVEQPCDGLDSNICSAAASSGDNQFLQEPTLRNDNNAVYLWANSASINCDKLEASAGLAVRGAVAKTSIAAKATVISIPRDLALSVVAGQRCPMPDLVPTKLWELSNE